MPVPASERRDGTTYKLTPKWCGQFHQCQIDHLPLEVIALYGNYAPYKYNLRHYSPVGQIPNDHADPSIFTGLAAPLGEPGTANIDFVSFERGG